MRAATLAVMMMQLPQCTTSDSCSAYLECSSCAVSAECGWCNGAKGIRGSCVPGGATGPLELAGIPQTASYVFDPLKDKMHQLGCQDWHFSFCPERSACTKYRGCSNCISDPFCGWCASSAVCSEGVPEGPIAGLTEGCKVGYAHGSPMLDIPARTIEVLVASSQNAAEALRRNLAETCEKADKEAEMHVEAVKSEQEVINATLVLQMETCLPCGGSWPMCDCEMLARQQESGTIDEMLDRGKSWGNDDPTYRPGTIYVHTSGDYAKSASISGAATGPAMSPEEASARAVARVAKMKAERMSSHMTQYVEAIKSLARARSLGDETGIAEAEMSAEGAKAGLNQAKAEASEAAQISSSAYVADDTIADLDKDFEELSKMTADKSRAIVSGDKSDQDIAEEKITELESSIKTARSIAAPTDPSKDGLQKVNFTEEFRNYLKYKEKQDLALKPDNDKKNESKLSDTASGGFDFPDGDGKDVNSTTIQKITEKLGLMSIANSSNSTLTDANSTQFRFRSRFSDITDSREKISEEPLQQFLRQVVATKGFGKAQQVLQVLGLESSNL